MSTYAKEVIISVSMLVAIAKLHNVYYRYKKSKDRGTSHNAMDITKEQQKSSTSQSQTVIRADSTKHFALVKFDGNLQNRDIHASTVSNDNISNDKLQYSKNKRTIILNDLGFLILFILLMFIGYLISRLPITVIGHVICILGIVLLMDHYTEKNYHIKINCSFFIYINANLRMKYLPNLSFSRIYQVNKGNTTTRIF